MFFRERLQSLLSRNETSTRKLMLNRFFLQTVSFNFS